MDGETGRTGTLGGSRWKEDAVNIRLHKDLGKEQSIKLWYNYKAGRDGYPISTPRLKYWNQDDWERIIFAAAVGQVGPGNVLIPNSRLAGDTKNPGYANLFALDGAVYNSFSKF